MKQIVLPHESGPLLTHWSSEWNTKLSKGDLLSLALALLFSLSLFLSLPDYLQAEKSVSYLQIQLGLELILLALLVLVTLDSDYNYIISFPVSPHCDLRFWKFLASINV